MVWTSQNDHDYPDEFMGRIDPAQLPEGYDAYTDAILGGNIASLLMLS